jgi:predicted RNA polymerase sigma factor
VPHEPEAHGLQALLEIQASRLRARRDADGEAVLIEQQDRRRWDWLLIRRGLAALDRAEATGRAVGPYVLQAAIAACHARARRAEDTDSVRIAELYDVVAEASPARSWRSIARSRTVAPTDPTLACGSSTRSPATRRGPACRCQGQSVATS